MIVHHLNQALLQPRLTYGVSTKALGLCWGPSAFFAVLASSSFGAVFGIAILSVAMIIHMIVRWMYKKDHRIFLIYSRYARLDDVYHPFSREKLPAHFERPQHFAKGIRL